MIRTIIIICLICRFAMPAGYAQRKPDADALFLKAREAAWSDQWAEARKICREILLHYPNHYDATLLMGSTYAWELKTDSARMLVSPLLDVEPDNVDVLNLLVNNEIWGAQYGKALDWLFLALEFYPSNEDFLFKRANVFYAQKDNVAAIRVLYELLTLNPEHPGGNDLLNNILPANEYIVDLYNKAEEEAVAGNWKLVRKYCRQVLDVEPNHLPASLLMGQTFAFENRFDSARIVSAALHSNAPKHYSVLELMVNIEIWNRKYRTAMTQVEMALEAYPNDENFLFKKAQIQYLNKDYRDALKTLDELLVINPDHEDGDALRKDIMENYRYRDYVFVEDYFEYFREPYLSRKLITSAGVAKWTKYGTYIAKVNIGEELPWQSPAFQWELEAYQRLFPTNYLLLNHAYSQNHFFPEHRGAFEFFQRLSKGFEASLGLRYLYWFDLLLIYTGSISWMKNKNYLALRAFFCHTHSTYTLNSTYRRYFSEKEDYVYAALGYGNYSDDFLQLNPDLGKSYMAQIGAHKFITARWFFLASIGYARDENKAYTNGYRNRFQASAGVRYYFNMFK